MQTKGFRQLTKIEDATEVFLQAVGDLKERVESIRIQDAVGRILARDAIARRYLPSADLSALDGYAVSIKQPSGRFSE